jgi:general secretion pathway protein G
LATRPDDANAFLKAQVQKSALKDPWGEPYQYRNPGLKNPDSFDLFSKGQDKTEGTEDDIGNW